MIAWIDRPSRQRSCALPDYIPPAAEPSDLINSRATRNRIFSEASLPLPPSLPYPTRNSGTARPITMPQLRSLFVAGGRCTSYGSIPAQPSLDPTCSICLDIDTEPGGPCKLSWDDCRHPTGKQTKSQWLFLPCGHRFHHACLAQACCSHPADGPNSHAALACPVCSSSADGSPPFIAGTHPGLNPTHAQSLILNLPNRPSNFPLSFTFTPPPRKHSPILPPITPTPCPLRHNSHCPFAGNVPCSTRLPTARDSLAHIRAHHRDRDLLCPPSGPPDLSSSGLSVCTDCVNVYLSSSFDDHASACQFRLRRLAHLADPTPLAPCPPPLAMTAANMWPTSPPAAISYTTPPLLPHPTFPQPPLTHSSLPLAVALPPTPSDLLRPCLPCDTDEGHAHGDGDDSGSGRRDNRDDNRGCAYPPDDYLTMN